MQELFTLAENGNEQALSTIINQALNSENITVQCYRHDTCLYVVLVSAETPEQSYCIKLINNQLNHLQTKSLKTVQVYGRKNNQADHIWTQTFELNQIPNSRPSFIQSWFGKSRQQPKSKATTYTTNLSLLLLSSISCFWVGTWSLVVKSQPDILINNNAKTETTVDLQNLFTETSNPFSLSTPSDKFNLKDKADTSAEKDNKSFSKSEKNIEKSENKSSSTEQPKLAETSDTSTENEKNNKSFSKSEKPAKQSEVKPSSAEQPKLSEKSDNSAEKNNKSFSKSEKPVKQSKFAEKPDKSASKSKKPAKPPEIKPSQAQSTEKKNSNKKNKSNKKSSNSTPEIKTKSDKPSESKTQSLTTKSVSKSSSQDTSSIDAELDKKVSTSEQTTQRSEAEPNKSSVTPKPTTKSSKNEKSTVPATSTPVSPASQSKSETSTKEKSADTSVTTDKSSKTKSPPQSSPDDKPDQNSEAIKQKLEPNPTDNSAQDKKSSDDLPAADKSSQPNSSWTSPSEEKPDRNPKLQPSVPSKTPKPDTTSTPQSTSQPSLPEKQSEKNTVDAPKSQPTKTPATEQKPAISPPENSNTGPSSKPRSSKNDGYITIKAVGDIVPGTNFPNNRLPDKNKIFEKVKKSLDGADILFGNFESTFTNSSRVGKDTSRPMVFAFRTPPTFANVFKKTGFDILSVANNHSLDFSQVGFTDTMKTIERAGMKPVGKKNEIVYKKVKDIPIAFIGFSSLDVHNSLNDLEAAKALVLEAKQNAKIVVISVHGGAEGTDAMRVKNKQENFHGENRGNMVLFSRTLIDNGADLVLGHGPHIVRAMELYKGKMIAYSLGNFVGYRTLSTAGDLAKSLVLQVKLNSKGNFVSGKILPVILDRQGLPYPDKQLGSVKLITKLTKSDFPNTDLAINRKGEIYKQFRTYRFFTLNFEGKPTSKPKA
ncbi:MAG TPA: CapA family protein [Oculatellaceae cyanobacterium]|jgi:poly-gamma-glutamate capsule biosynthesis protein CapA/YwtB (metallophosphatase superfamily)